MGRLLPPVLEDADSNYNPAPTVYIVKAFKKRKKRCHMNSVQSRGLNKPTKPGADPGFFGGWV